MATDSYEAFIDEAFIKPIRSVLIVDDDYPTFEDILAEEDTSNKDWRTKRDSIRKVIAHLRGPDRNLLIDIHDGTNVDVESEIDTATHLHQSDLLVLDFQLDKAKQHDGTTAVKIIRRLMNNPHFNLVVVHTSEQIDYVFQHVLLGMLPPDEVTLTADETDRAEELIARCDDADPGFSLRLADSFTITQYLEVRRLGVDKSCRAFLKDIPPFSAFRANCETANWRLDDLRLIFRYAIATSARSLMNYPPEPNLPKIDWSEGDVKWIRSRSLFIAFANKFDDEPPLTELSQALTSWRPDPSRLYLARLRHEIDERGTAEQATDLGNTHALAGWYHRILTSDPVDTRRQIEQTVGRLTESFLSPITARVGDFAERLISLEKEQNIPLEVCRQHFKVDLSDEIERIQAMGQHNSVVSTKKPEGWHLTTGHIFHCDDTYWVCTSPACDMVPSQLSAFSRVNYPGCIPFTAICLQPIASLKTAVELANSTRVIFIEVDGKIQAFCFNNPGDDSSGPQWTLLFAKEDGQFIPGTYDFRLIRMISDGTENIIAQLRVAKVVSQLRYEYALNLVQKLGVSMTRIGLDFRAPARNEKPLKEEKRIGSTSGAHLIAGTAFAEAQGDPQP